MKITKYIDNIDFSRGEKDVKNYCLSILSNEISNILSENQENFEKSDTLKQKIALYSNAEYMKNLMEYSEIQKSTLKEVKNNNETIYQLSADCLQEIGELQEIYIEKNGDKE